MGDSKSLHDVEKIVLACADGLSNVEVAQTLGVAQPTVRKWRSRFAERRPRQTLSTDLRRRTLDHRFG